MLAGFTIVSKGPHDKEFNWRNWFLWSKSEIEKGWGRRDKTKLEMRGLKEEWQTAVTKSIRKIGLEKNNLTWRKRTRHSVHKLSTLIRLMRVGRRKLKNWKWKVKLRKEQGARQENNEEVQNFVTGEVTGNKRNKKKTGWLLRRYL